MKVIPRKKHLHLTPDGVRAKIDGCAIIGCDTCPFFNWYDCKLGLLQAAGSALDEKDEEVFILIKKLERAVRTIYRLKEVAGRTCVGCQYEDGEWNRDVCTSCPYNNGNNWIYKEDE